MVADRIDDAGRPGPVVRRARSQRPHTSKARPIAISSRITVCAFFEGHLVTRADLPFRNLTQAGQYYTERFAPPWATQQDRPAGRLGPIGLQARGSAPLRLQSASIAARGPGPQWLSGRPMTSPNA